MYKNGPHFRGEAQPGGGSVRLYQGQVEIDPLKESVEEGPRFIRDANDLIRRLAIELEIKFGLGLAVLPVGKRFELAATQALPGEGGTPDCDAHAWRLPRDAAFLGNRLDRGDDTLRDETWPAFILTGEDVYRIAWRDVFAGIHRLLCAERECLCL